MLEVREIGDSTMTLLEAQAAAEQANINRVASFLGSIDAKEYDRTTIQCLIEDLMQAYISDLNGKEKAVDHYSFLDISRICRMQAGKIC